MNTTAAAIREALDYVARQYRAKHDADMPPVLVSQIRLAIQGVVARYERDLAAVLDDIEARYRAETSDPTAATKADGVMRAASEVAAGIDGYVFRAAEQPRG